MRIKYWRIGTDPSKYIKNWLQIVTHVSLGEKLIIDDMRLLKQNNEVIFNSNSMATFNQNLICWEAFGLCKKTGAETLLILDNETQTFNDMLEKIKWGLLIKTNNHQCQALKNSIMIRLLFANNSIPSTLVIEPIKNKTNNEDRSFTYSKLSRDIGLLDRKLFEDKIFVDTVCKIWNKGE